jgi:hypothetical protein
VPVVPVLKIWPVMAGQNFSAIGSCDRSGRCDDPTMIVRCRWGRWCWGKEADPNQAMDRIVNPMEGASVCQGEMCRRWVDAGTVEAVTGGDRAGRCGRAPG